MEENKENVEVMDENFKNKSMEGKENTSKKNMEEKEESQGKRIVSEILSWVRVIVFAVILAYVLGNFVFMNAYIPSGSMEDTLHVKDRVIGFRLSYLFDEPERFDVVMFKFPDNEKKDYIKRIIGLPGETVTIKEGKVYINDSEVPLDEPYVKGTPTGAKDGEYKVPKGCYFMLGDNRNNSEDSPFWDNKYVKKEKILAKAWFKFYPELDWIETDY